MPTKVASAEHITLPHDIERICVVADTHSALHPATLELLAARAPAAIIHAGDIGDPAVLEQLADVAPLHAIRGNIDPKGLPDTLLLELGTLRILVVHIGVAGPHLRREVIAQARAERATMVICGHSHVPFIGVSGGLTVFNPGSCGPRRFHLPIVFGTMSLASSKLRLAHVDCETGAAWLPP